MNITAIVGVIVLVIILLLWYVGSKFANYNYPLPGECISTNTKQSTHVILDSTLVECILQADNEKSDGFTYGTSQINGRKYCILISSPPNSNGSSTINARTDHVGDSTASCYIRK